MIDKDAISEELDNQNNDEVYLFEVVSFIWGNKRVVLAFILVFLAIGLVYCLTTKTVYEIKIPYVENTPQKNVDLVFVEVLAAGGVVNVERKHKHKGNVVLLSENRSDLNVISEKIKSANAKVTLGIIEKAKKEMVFLANELPESIKGSDVVAERYLANKALIEMLEKNEARALTISNPMMSIKSPKTTLIIVLLFFLGLVTSVFYLFLKRRVLKYHNRSAA